MYFKKNHYKEDDIRIQYSNEFILNTGLGDPKTCVYQFTSMKMTVMTQILYNILLCIHWCYASSYIILWHICFIRGHSVMIIKCQLI